MQVDVYRFENTAPPFLQPKKKKRNPTVAFPGSVIDPCQVGVCVCVCVMNKRWILFSKGVGLNQVEHLDKSWN